MSEPLSRQRVVECACSIVRAEGSRALGLRRVGRELGVTAPALYGYVDSLDDLLRAVAESQFEVLANRFEALPNSSAPEKVRMLSQTYIEYAREEPELFKLLFRFPPDVGGSGIEHELPIATKVWMAATEPLIEGHDSGEFPHIEPLQASLAVWAAVHGCATALCMGFDFDEVTATRLIDEVLGMVLAGLRS